MTIHQDDISAQADTELEIIVNDPWEFASAWGDAPRRARVLRRKAEPPHPTTLLLQLLSPVSYQSVLCEYLVASPRYVGQDMSMVWSIGRIEASVTCIPEARAINADPFDLSWWRGGSAGLATLSKPPF
jgi:hypothetical protein